MKKVLGMLSAAALAMVALGGSAIALDDGVGGTGGGTSACKACSRTFLPFQGVYTAQCASANAIFPSGYRSCIVKTTYPGGNQDCSFDSWGACSVEAGGGGGGFIP